MPFFKDLQNRLYAYEDDADPKYIKPGLTPITQAEAAALLAPTPEQVAATELAAARAQAMLAAKQEAKTDAIVQFLRDRTLAECDQYVVANVTDFASAKAYLRKLTLVVAALAKQELQ